MAQKIPPKELQYLRKLIYNDAWWGARHFHLNEREAIKFKECLNFSYLGIAPSVNYELMDFDIFGDKWDEVGATPIALLFAVMNIYKDRLRSYRELVIPIDDLCGGESEDYSVTSDAADCMAAHLAADTSENNRIKYFLDEASKITITKKNNNITKCQIQTRNVGSMSLPESYIDILNEEESESELIASFKRGTITFEEKGDIVAFRDIITRYFFYPFGNDKFIYGEKRNSLRKRYIETMYPVVEMIDKRLRVQCAAIFKDMSKRDIYRFILKLFDAEDLFTIELMERYLKTENRNAKYNFDWGTEDPADEIVELPF